MTERLHFHFSLSCIGEGNGNPLQCSCLEKPRDGGAWWAAVYGVAQSRTRLKQLSSSSSSLIDWLIIRALVGPLIGWFIYSTSLLSFLNDTASITPRVVTAVMKLKNAYSLKRKLWQTQKPTKKQRDHFADKGPDRQSYGFSSSDVPMWELDAEELMLLNCGAGENSWESLGQQGSQISQS